MFKKKKKAPPEPEFFLSATNMPTRNFRVYYMKRWEKFGYALLAFVAGAAVGYLFYGGLGKDEFGQPTTITKDITLFAQWKPLAPPTTTTTTTTTTITTTTEEITTTEETTTPTTVEETTTWLPGSETTITPETSPTLPTDPIDGEDDSDKPSVPLIIGFIIGASVIGGLGGFIIFSIREKKKYG
jgi:hypothetical protein